MRLISNLSVLYLWLLLFLLFSDLRCQAFFSGLDFRQLHDKEEQTGNGIADQDGVDEDSFHGIVEQDGVDDVSLCISGDQDGVDELSLHGKLNPGTRFTAPEGNVNVHSSSVDFPCPEAVDIEPCLCTVDAEQNIDLDCTDVNSEEQLAAVFQQEFPVKKLRFFNMTENSNIKVLDNILNEVTFQKISIQPGPFALSAISEYFFLNCRETLDLIYIYDTNLTSAAFPFATFAVMENLHYIEVTGSSFTWIPRITAPGVSGLSFTYGKIEVVQSGSFPIHEGPIFITLYHNSIHTIEPGSFYFADENSLASNKEVRISFDSNLLRSLQAGTFPIRNGPTQIFLHNNQIEVIEPGTFVLPGDTSQLRLYLYLDENQLTAFSEEVFGELMPYAALVQIDDNPLVCDCALAWMITNPEYLAKIRTATCKNGTFIYELNPDDFLNFC